MRSHAALLSSRLPSTACSASTECGGRRNDSIWASPGTARAKRSEPAGAEGAIFYCLLEGGMPRSPNAASTKSVTSPLFIQLDKPVDILCAPGGLSCTACGGKYRATSSWDEPAHKRKGPL